MAMTDRITISLGDDVQDAILRLDSARIRVCRAQTCKNNRLTLGWGDLGCNLRDVQVAADGRCESFEPRKAE